MILVVDSTTLTLLVNPASSPPLDPATDEPVVDARERVEFLVASLTAGDTLVIPTPVLAEVLVTAADAGPEVLQQLTDLARVRIEPFDQRAAVETAYMTREAIAAGHKKGGSPKPWQAVKIDRQVVAVGRVHGADRLYTDDGDLADFARALRMDVVSTADLPRPPVDENLFTSAGMQPDGSGDTSPGEESAGIVPPIFKPRRAVVLRD